MANTINIAYNTTGNRKTVIYYTLLSDGSNQTASAVYTSATACTTLGITDTKNSAIVAIHALSNSASAVIHLLWKASSNVLAFTVPRTGAQVDMDFNDIGGLQNTSTTGKTGDILITTTGLASGESITLVLEVKVEG